MPLLFNADVTISTLQPDASDPVYFVNADGDDLFFVKQGGGVLRSMLGDVPFAQDDYVFVPKGVLHRFELADGPQEWLSMELHGGLHLPKQWRNEVGQLRMDAPFCHSSIR